MPNKKPGVTYSHEVCNITPGTVHLRKSSYQKIFDAMLLVDCAATTGIETLKTAVYADDIHGAMVSYADSVMKLDTADFIFAEHTPIYDDSLAVQVERAMALSKQTRVELDGWVSDFHKSVRARLR
jgi:hypothetical protein